MHCFTYCYYIHLEKGMATHSSILAWRIPRIEEPGRLQSTGSQESDMTERLSTHYMLNRSVSTQSRTRLKRLSGSSSSSTNITFICTRKPKILWDSLYCNIHFITVVWNQTHNIVELCLCS